MQAPVLVIHGPNAHLPFVQENGDYLGIPFRLHNPKQNLTLAGREANLLDPARYLATLFKRFYVLTSVIRPTKSIRERKFLPGSSCHPRGKDRSSLR
jgi:hypothetical protein